jgi:hypothetical protein
MRWIHWALAASLLFNGLALAGYFYARQLGTADERVVHAFALRPAQRAELRTLRRDARVHALRNRFELDPQLEALTRSVREARPGADRIEPALRALAEARIPSQLRLARRLVAFREQLEPAQQETFNRMLGRRGFALGLLGFLPGNGKSWVTDASQPAQTRERRP